jgi:8-oxo-dGTP pyrophosphatase MutT (NUDIX family)
MASETRDATSTRVHAHAWPALAASTRREVQRWPFRIGGVLVGSVATAHVDALRAWPHDFCVDATGAQLVAAHRDIALARTNAALREQGLIVAWRDETYAIVERLGAPPLALIERAASRFWGTLTFGAHANGYVADGAGRPTQLWVARRSAHKATDPGKLDNLVGGGVPFDQTPFEALLREGFEEAGLDATTMRRAVPGSVIELACDIAEGFMHEQLHSFDLQLPAGLTPVNLDGEVAELRCLPIDEAIALAAGDAMTVDAALVTLDFALRHRLLGNDEHAALSARMAALLPFA